VISSSKSIKDSKDFGVKDNVSRKVIVKDLVQALHEDPLHKHKLLVYRLSNNLT